MIADSNPITVWISLFRFIGGGLPLVDGVLVGESGDDGGDVVAGRVGLAVARGAGVVAVPGGGLQAASVGSDD